MVKVPECRLILDNFGLTPVRRGVPEGYSGIELNRSAADELQLLFRTGYGAWFMKLLLSHDGNLIRPDN